MKYINLTQGKVTKVDDDDFDRISNFKWHAIKSKNGHKFYAASNEKINGKYKTTYLHKMIMNTQKGFDTDHIDGDGLNNQKSNLRITTRSQNSMNRGGNSNSYSGLKGVYWIKSRRKWGVFIYKEGKNKYGGYFLDKNDAYKRYCDLLIKERGEFTHF